MLHLKYFGISDNKNILDLSWVSNGRPGLVVFKRWTNQTDVNVIIITRKKFY